MVIILCPFPLPAAVHSDTHVSAEVLTPQQVCLTEKHLLCFPVFIVKKDVNNLSSKKTFSGNKMESLLVCH